MIATQPEKLRILNVLCPNDTSSEEINSSRLLKKISLVRKIMRKYSIERIPSLFVVAEESKYRIKTKEWKRK